MSQVRKYAVANPTKVLCFGRAKNIILLTLDLVYFLGSIEYGLYKINTPKGFN